MMDFQCARVLFEPRCLKASSFEAVLRLCALKRADVGFLGRPPTLQIDKRRDWFQRMLMSKLQEVLADMPGFLWDLVREA